MSFKPFISPLKKSLSGAIVVPFFLVVKQSKILEAEGNKRAAILKAEGESEAILKIKQAEAEGIKLIKEASADQAVLTLKAYEALSEVSKGQATKIIIPSELQGMAGIVSALKGISEDK